MGLSFGRFMRNYSLNNLGSIWYCIIATSLQIYIITRSIYRFTAYVALPWPNGQPPAHSINTYMLLIGCSIVILPFFIVVGLVKVGNYSNDGRKAGIFQLGRYTKHLITETECLHQDSEPECQSVSRAWLHTVWKHSLPVAPLLHMLISLCFLFPRLITEAQLIRHGFLSKANIWKTDLDVVLAKYNGRQWNFFGLLRTIDQREHRSLFNESATLGQYFIRNSKTLSERFSVLDESGLFSLELANFLLALFILTVRYPAVFWRINKCFSVLFSAQLLLNMCQSVIALCAFQVTFKIFVCDPTHLMLRFRDSSSLGLTQLSVLLCAYILVLQLSGISVHFYGMQKYREYRYARTKYLQAKYQSKPFYSHLSYLLAMTFFLALSFLVGPLFYEFVIVYCGSLSISTLLMILSTIVYFTCWIVLWVCLAIKTEWTFDYDDFEKDDLLLDQASCLQYSPLVIINQGKMFRVKDDAAKQAILNFVQDTSPSSLGIDYENNSNQFLDRSQHNRMSVKSARSERPYGGQFSKASNCRYSTRSYRKPKSRNNRFDCYDGSESDGEYTTFRKLTPTNSFRQTNGTQSAYNASKVTEDQFTVNMCAKQSSLLGEDGEPTYGFNFMFNPLVESENEPSSPTLTASKASDTSSGIHSASNSSLTFCSLDKSSRTKSNSLESLMQTLQKLEAAAADKPKLRTLSSLQRSVNILNTFDKTTDPKPCHVNLTSFLTENSIYGARIEADQLPQSKLMEFNSKPDYSKYYMSSNSQ